MPALRLTRRFSYLELFCQVGRPLAPHGGRHLLALLLGGKDAVLVNGAVAVVVVVLFADVLVALVHGLRVTEDAEAEEKEGREKKVLSELFFSLCVRCQDWDAICGQKHSER